MTLSLVLYPERSCRATDSALRLCTIQASPSTSFPPPAGCRHSSAFSEGKGLHSLPTSSLGPHLRTLHSALLSGEVIHAPKQLSRTALGSHLHPSALKLWSRKCHASSQTSWASWLYTSAQYSDKLLSGRCACKLLLPPFLGPL